MKIWKNLSVAITLLVYAATLDAQPRLVVGIVVDQMRWDYLERYLDRYGEGGMRRLMNEGYNCTQCMINYLPAVTAVGHASVYTGSVPAFTGIVGNHFEVDGKSTASVYDKNMKTVGSDSRSGEASPHLLLPTTMTDELRLATNFRGKVVGIALKDRAAILPAGHAANAAYWLDRDNQHFITSSYYMDSLPQWVKDFNARELATEYMKRDWPNRMMYAPDTYVQSHPRDERIELTVGDNIRTTPWGATITLDMARAAIEGEQLGKDEIPDFLAVSLSNTDAIAHQTGTNSPCIEDTYLWLDRDLEAFFNYLDKHIGKNQWTVFLTADHAGQHALQFRADHHLPATPWESTGVVKEMNKLLSEKLGKEGRYVKGIQSFKMALDYDLIREAGGNVEQLTDTLCRRLLQLPEVAYAFDIERIPDYVPEPLPTMLRNGYNPKRCGRIMIVPEAGVAEAMRYGKENMKGTSHALWTPDDTHIACVFMGYGVPKGKRDNRKVYITDIAPTICSLLRIQQPSSCIGAPIF